MQTMAQQMRFHTRELTDIEGAARAASAGAVERESALFASLVSTLLEHTDRLRALAAALAVRVPFVVSSFATLWERVSIELTFDWQSIDVASALAHIAAERNFCRPQIECVCKSSSDTVAHISDQRFRGNACSGRQARYRGGHSKRCETLYVRSERSPPHKRFACRHCNLFFFLCTDQVRRTNVASNRP